MYHNFHHVEISLFTNTYHWRQFSFHLVKVRYFRWCCTIGEIEIGERFHTIQSTGHWRNLSHANISACMVYVYVSPAWVTKASANIYTTCGCKQSTTKFCWFNSNAALRLFNVKTRTHYWHCTCILWNEYDKSTRARKAGIKTCMSGLLKFRNSWKRLFCV